MDNNRRSFLKKSLLGSTLIGWGPLIPSFICRTAHATPPAERPGARDTILVVVELTGGNDGLNTVIPYKDPEYARLRPTLGLPPSQIKKIDGAVGLHPSLDGLARLLEDNALCVVQGVGYPNPSQSHFRSMDIWQAGSTAATSTEGWLGKSLARLPRGQAFHLAQANQETPLALAGAPARVPSVATLEDFQLRLSAASREDRKAQRSALENFAASGNGNAGLVEFVQQTAAATYASSQKLQEINKNYQPRAPYPASGLGQRLRLAAQLIDAELGARIFYVAQGGFDTHASQSATHSGLLRELGDAISAFFRDMAARGHRDRILLMTFSEFGRRARENGSRGTDHGSAAPMFLVGGKVKRGIVGKHPSLTDLEFGNLKHQVDFRQVYAALVDGWLGVSSKEVLGGAHAHAPVL